MSAKFVTKLFVKYIWNITYRAYSSWNEQTILAWEQLPL